MIKEEDGGTDPHLPKALGVGGQFLASTAPLLNAHEGSPRGRALDLASWRGKALAHSVAKDDGLVLVWNTPGLRYCLYKCRAFGYVSMRLADEG